MGGGAYFGILLNFPTNSLRYCMEISVEINGPKGVNCQMRMLPRMQLKKYDVNYHVTKLIFHFNSHLLEN